jgi:pyruvate/2-oxoglutarate dehydrogenase complex dihydrolipoamide dehydrogenase (E3) component
VRRHVPVARCLLGTPKIADAGLTEEQARDQGIKLATARIGLADAIERLAS